MSQQTKRNIERKFTVFHSYSVGSFHDGGEVGSGGGGGGGEGESSI